MHLGTGREVAIGEVVRLVSEMIGRPLDVIEEAARVRPPNSEVTRLLSDPSNARERLGWEPTVTLEEGLRRTDDWLARPRRLVRVRRPGGVKWMPS